MKRKLFSASLVIAIALIAMLNVKVVLDSKTRPIVKLTTLATASADEFSSSSGNSSGDDSGDSGASESWENDTSNTNGFYDSEGYVPPGKRRKKMSDLFNGTSASTGNSVTTNGVSQVVRGQGTWKLTAGGKLAETGTSGTTSPGTGTGTSTSGNGTSGEVSAGVTYEFGKNNVVTYNSHTCDKSNSSPCQAYNTFVSTHSF